jgi:hypothetical protein
MEPAALIQTVITTLGEQHPDVTKDNVAHVLKIVVDEHRGYKVIIDKQNVQLEQQREIIQSLRNITQEMSKLI